MNSFLLKVIFSHVFILIYNSVNSEKENTNNAESTYLEEMFLKLYKEHRALQLEALKGFQKLKRYEKQYEMAEILSKKIFSVVDTNRALLESSGFMPGISSFPTDEETRTALASVLVNTAFFGEIILRLPDITSRLLRRHKEWEVQYQWCITFFHQVSYMVDKPSIKLISLVEQELNYTTRDPDYHNPYRVQTQSKKHLNSNGTDNKKSNKFSSGPRVSRLEL